MKSVITIHGVVPDALFERFVSDMAASLGSKGLEFTPGPAGHVDEGSVRIGLVTRWSPPRLVEVDWRPGSAWGSDKASKLRISFEPVTDGTDVVFETDAPDALVEDRGLLLSDWFVDEIIAPAAKAVSPDRFSAWLTDRRARRPSGEAARATYRDPVYHRPNFKAILHRLGLTRDDRLLEVGCGGGAFLADALRCGCEAAAVDHSADMVAVAREANAGAVAEGRLVLKVAEADSLSFPDGGFTAVVCTGVFGLVDRPSAVMSEMCRVLRPGGRLALFTDSAELRGTEAAPEPIASHSNFFSDDDLLNLARRAGFSGAKVERPDLGPYAREAGLPDELVKAFSGPGQCQLLLAEKR